MRIEIVVENVTRLGEQTVMGPGNTYIGKTHTATVYNIDAHTHGVSREDVARFIDALRAADIGVSVRFI